VGGWTVGGRDVGDASLGARDARDGRPGNHRVRVGRQRAPREFDYRKLGPKGVAAARTSLWLDFGYMSTYGVFAALLAEGADRRLARRRSGVRLFPWAQVACAAAVAADAREGVALLNVLRGRDRQAHTARARRAALTKFGLLSVVLLYWARSHARPPFGVLNNQFDIAAPRPRRAKERRNRRATLGSSLWSRTQP
jgi:hypothetical protein